MELLKSGQGIETWREGDRVVKRVDLDPRTLRQLAYEARLLADLGLEQGEVHPDRLVRAWREGPTLDQLPLPLPDLTPFLHLLRLLEQAHARGLLHLNLKPENLLWTSAGLEPLDFGLARFSRVRGRLADLPAADVRFVAPEVSGLVRGEVGPQADLYSVGALLHLAQTGSPPYAGHSASDVLRATLTERVPAPNPVVERLLARNPRDRYANATEVLRDLRALLAGRKLTRHGSGGPAEPTFVGRVQELARLEGAAGVSLVEGEAGIGKTRLLHELAPAFASTYYCSARPEPRPLQLFSGLLSDLLLRADWSRLAPGLGVYAGLLAGAFQELEPVLGTPSSLAGVPPGLLAAALVRLVHLLEGACLLLDDLQWADSVSLEAVRRLAADPPPATRVIAAWRPFPNPPGEPTLVLERLPADASAALLRSMGLEGDRVSDLCELSGGNPLLLVEGLRGSWEGSRVKVGEGAAELLSRRLDAFRTPVLEGVAVLGTAARAPAVAFVLESDPADGLEEARRAGLLWREAGGVYHFAHDRLRETVLAEMHDKLGMHRRAALYHEELAEPGPAAMHWLAAGEPERAAPLALEAARASRQRLDHATALEFYALVPAPDYEVADSLRLVGRRREAYERAAQGLAKEGLSRLERARLLTIQGRARQDLDQLEEAESLLTEALSSLKVLGPVLPWWALLRPIRTVRDEGGEDDAEAALALELVHQLSEVLAHLGRTFRNLKLLRQAVYLAQRRPRLAQSGVIISLISIVQLFMGLQGTAQETARHARALLHRGDPYNRGRGHARASMTAWCQPAFSRVTRMLATTVENLKQGSGDTYEITVARYAYGMHLCAAGGLSEVRELGQEIVRQCQEADDNLFLGLGLSLWAQATYGDVPREQLDKALSRPPSSHFQSGQLDVAVALAELRGGRPDRALAALTRSEVPAAAAPHDKAIIALWRAVACRQLAEVTGDEGHYRQARRYLRPLFTAQQSWFKLTGLAALREGGLLAAARGHSARSRKLLDEAVQLAVQCEAWYEAAQSRLAWGRTGLALGWKGADEQLEQARHDLRQMGASWFVDTPVADPVQAVIGWGRELAARPSRLEEACAELPEVSRFFASVAEAATLNLSRDELQAEVRLELRRQEQELRALFGAAGVGLVVVSEGVVREENETFRAWAGASWVGRPAPGPGEHELASGLLSRWTTSDGRLYTVTLVVQLGQLEAAQAASREARAQRLHRLGERLSQLGLETSFERLGLVGGEGLDLPVALDRPLPSLTARTLQRLLQEALANARRHAPGAKVEVSVRCEEGWVVGSVVDDGPGFDPLAVTGRMGVRGMQWRARFCGGECAVESAPGKGTAVRFRLPL